MWRFLAVLPLLILPAFYPIGFFTHEKFEFDPVAGPYATNMDLNDAELKLADFLLAPESFATRENDSWVYTGLNGGSIVRFNPETFAVQLVAKSEDPGCAGVWDKRCGRPLGLRFRSQSELLVADANRGLISVDVDAGAVKTLIRAGTLIDGVPLMLTNDLDVDSNGNVYFSQSSSDVGLDFGIFTALAGGSGRLLRLDAETGEVKVLLTRIHFANGVQLSRDQSFVLVADTIKGKIMRYYLSGPKKDTVDTFIKGIPGGVDNIRASGRKNGGFVAAVPMVWDEANPNLLVLLADYPLIRAGLARVLWVIRLPFEWITDLYPNQLTGVIKHSIGGFGLIDVFTGVPHSMVIELDEAGKVVRSMHAINTDFVRISCAYPHEGRLYLGSYVHDAVAVVPWK